MTDRESIGECRHCGHTPVAYSAPYCRKCGGQYPRAENYEGRKNLGVMIGAIVKYGFVWLVLYMSIPLFLSVFGIYARDDGAMIVALILIILFLIGKRINAVIASRKHKA